MKQRISTWMLLVFLAIAIQPLRAEVLEKSKKVGGTTVNYKVVLPNGFDAAMGLYREALVFAMRFNRFLLDEALAGRPGSPLPAVIPRCQAQGAEGTRMMQSLRDWWASGANTLDQEAPESISPIRKDIPLVEAERAGRATEPGSAGAGQPTVIEQLDAAIS